MPRKKATPPPALVAPTEPVTITLHESYEAAVASKTELAPWAEAILGVSQIDGAGQQEWAAARGVEVHTKLKAEEAALKAELAPIAKLEATIRGYRADNLAQLRACKAHLIAILDESRARAAAAAAPMIAHAATEQERAEALAVVTPKPEGWVEVERWEWAFADPPPLPELVAREDDGSIVLRYRAGVTLPVDYWTPDATRIAREVAEHKGATNIPGVRVTCTTKGHFRS